MASLKEYRDERLRKLEVLKKLGVDAYPAKAARTHFLADITGKFDELNGQTVTVVGRVMNVRRLGKIAFLVIRDQSGQLQLFFGQDKVAGLDAKQSQLG